MTEMTRSGVRHLPVLEDGHLCGILSIRDAVKSVLEEIELRD
jgi:CBS domain-containing protein